MAKAIPMLSRRALLLQTVAFGLAGAACALGSRNAFPYRSDSTIAAQKSITMIPFVCVQTLKQS